MAGMRSIAASALSLILFGTSAVRAARTVRAARIANTPVQQVLQTLGEMKVKAGASMETEEKTYREYKNWVEGRTRELGYEIKTGESTIEQLTSFVGEAEDKAASLAGQISTIDGDVAKLEGDMSAAKKVRETEHGEFLTVQQDYSESVDALEQAIQTISAQDYDRSQAGALLQRMARRTKGMRRVLAALLQAQARGDGAPAVAAYEFQSSKILDLLKNLLVKFRDELDGVETAEANQAHSHEMLMLHIGDTVKRLTTDRDEKAGRRATIKESSAKAKGDLATAKKDLASDKALLQEMSATFKTKTAVYEENQKVRKDELEALAKAIEIISDPSVADSYATHINLAQAPRQATLLQLRSSRASAVARRRAAEILRERASALSSRTLSALASEVEANPFAKVIEMIKGLLARLKEEAASEADHKSWCDGQLKDNKLRRNAKTAAVEGLMAQVEGKTSDIVTMGKDIETLVKEQAELTKAIAERTAQRQKEKAENTDTIADAKAGAEAVKKAIVVLEEFYSAQASLAQVASRRQVPEMEAYKGMQGGKKGVVGMLEVISSDFLRLLGETEAAEHQAATEYADFMSVSQKDKKAKHEHEVKLRLDKDQAEFERERLQKDLAAEEKALGEANAYYENLKPSCVQVHVSFEERTLRRKEEIAALKEAYEVLDAKSAA